MSADRDARERLAEAIADRTPEGTDAELARDDSGDAAMDLIARVGRGFRGATDDAGGGEPAPTRWGPLQILRPLGEGSFGDVVVAWDPTLQREVALKLRRPDAGGGAGATSRWLEEGRRLARVRHLNVLTVHGADEHDGRAGLWTDLVPGRSLEDGLALNGPLSAREAALVGAELCSALAAVHAAGLVHGDVKTRNVVRAAGERDGGGAGRVVLVDFGAASESSGDAAAGSHGTPLALSPERLAGAPADASADLWALGVLLFRLVTGRYPLQAESLVELREKSARGERARLLDVRPDLPRTFVSIVERALAREPRERFATAAEFEAELSRFLTGRAARTTARRATVALVAVVVLAAFAGAWWFLRAPRSVPSPGVAPTPASVPPSGDLAATSPPPATPPAPAPLRVEASMLRWRDGEAQVLVDGGRIEPGDRLSLAIEAGEALHVYVLDEDGRGEVTTLFPFAGGGLANPLRADRRHELPGRREGESLRWLVTSAEGRETFLVVAARQPLAPIERAVAALPRVREGESVRYATLGAAELQGLRGVSTVVAESTAAPGAGGRLVALARSLDAARAKGDLWMRLVRVANPAR